MPRFIGFPGLRYDNELAPLAEVIAPPYDVVDAIEREKLAERSEYNAIHVELPIADVSSDLDQYDHAARLLSAWENAGVIRRDDVASLYIYRMRFVDDQGEERSTTGVIGALGVEPAHGGSVLPHERTMPKPKGDRLNLLRATRMNLSPIWGLSLSEGLTKACAEAIGESLPLTAVDDDGVGHDIWPVTDARSISEITALIDATPIVIADGHHRYETARFFQAEQRAEQNDAAGEHDFVMALIVELTPEELVVRPIHRLVSGLFDPSAIDAVLDQFFEVGPGPSDTNELVREMTAQGSLGLITPEGSRLLKPLPSLDEASEADLDSSRLDVFLAALPAHELTYQHGSSIVANAVADGAAQAAFLLRPATVEQIATTADSGLRMPPKTTFFHPKPRTGLVYRHIV